MLHRPGPFHVEVPERLEAIYSGIENAGLLPELIVIEASRADLKWVEAVHDRGLIERLETACCAGEEVFECADNQMCADTYETALLAAGGVVDTVRMMMEGTIDNAFCAVRPPGHHAETHSAMGFCYFNNVAIAARYLQMEWNIERVGIIDFDVHHGNGTQQIFEKDSAVFYYSIHEHPSFAYPGTGREIESGIAEGSGFTKNSPVMPGKGDDEYKRLVQKDLFPAFDAFKPEVVLVSAGFDAHVDDRLADIRLSTQWYSWIMEEVVDLAEKHAKGRLVSVLEGGYALQRLPELAMNHVEILLGK